MVEATDDDRRQRPLLVWPPTLCSRPVIILKRNTYPEYNITDTVLIEKSYYTTSAMVNNIIHAMHIQFSWSSFLCQSHFRDGVKIPRKGQFLGLSGQLKSIESLLWCMQQTDKSVLNNGTTGDVAFCLHSLTTFSLIFLFGVAQ